MTYYRARIDLRVKLLTDALKKELLMSAERSIRGGPRVARRAVTQLIRLGKSSQVSDLLTLIDPCVTYQYYLQDVLHLRRWYSRPPLM